MNPFPKPLLLEFIDNPAKKNRRFQLIAPFVYKDRKDCIEIPPLYDTDFASIPRCFWFILPPVGLYGKAAVVHDYLCDECEKCNYQYPPETKTRAEADRIFLNAMKILGVAVWKRYPMYWAVYLWGRFSEWKGKRRAQNNRTFPPATA